MSVTPPMRPAGQGRRVRGRQRAAHPATGALLVLYVYLPGSPDAVLQTGIRWVALPLLVVTGVLMWQRPKLRRLIRARSSRSHPGRTTTASH